MRSVKGSQIALVRQRIQPGTRSSIRYVPSNVFVIIFSIAEGVGVGLMVEPAGEECLDDIGQSQMHFVEVERILPDSFITRHTWNACYKEPAHSVFL